MDEPYESGPFHSSRMPREYHHISCVLLTEIRMADTLQRCIDAASALGHARLLAEAVARDTERFACENDAGSTEPTDV